jgi:hypothetical protein
VALRPRPPRRSVQCGAAGHLDEATLAGTLTLDQITAHAAEVGAKVLLVGDPAQLQAVEAGGAFALLAAVRQTGDGAPELTEVHRFTLTWEKQASLALRHGRDEAIDASLENDRVHDGDTEAMVEAAYAAWHADLADGWDSVLVAGGKTRPCGPSTNAPAGNDSRPESQMLGRPSGLLTGSTPRRATSSSLAVTTAA